ncbi:MAG: hypothetical protein K8U57_11765 [Planctomycetes bacterium]|nr:hypothetical protein [Planctomycetota bacterium]
MRPAQMLILLFACIQTASLGQSQTAADPKKDTKPPAKKEKELAPGYKTHKIEGFTFLISEEALAQDVSGYEKKPLEALQMECAALVKVLTPKTVELMRGMVIWVEWDEQVKLGNGRQGNSLAVYMGGDAAQMVREGKHPLRAKTITIHSLKLLTQGRQPKADRGDCVLLHEFAHAVHDQLIGNNNLAIKNAYQQAMERKLYDKDQYVATNDHEFFAELSCAYLDKLRYFPYNRADLKKHDPASFKVIEAAWAGAAKKDVPATVPAAADGSDRFDLNLALPADVKFGEVIAGPAPTAASLTGKIVVIGYWGGSSSNALNRLDRIHDTLGAYGVVVVAPFSSTKTAAEIKAEAAKRGDGFAVLEKAFVKDKDMPGTLKTQPGGHALVFDTTGKCVFRGSAYDADKPARIAVGQKLLGESLGSTPPAAFKPVVDAFAAGGDPVAVYAKVAPLTRASDDSVKDAAKKLADAILAPGQQALTDAQALQKNDPVAALVAAEEIATRFKGTPLATSADTLLTKLRQDKAVAVELRARGVLAQLRKLETFLAGQPGSFDPVSADFQGKNKASLTQMQTLVDQLRKQYPMSRAMASAEKLAAEFGLK